MAAHPTAALRSRGLPGPPAPWATVLAVTGEPGYRRDVPVSPTDAGATGGPGPVTRRSHAAEQSASGLPIKMLNDRILVRIESAEGERRSSGGILIPATAQVGKRLAWAKVVATGANVRAMQQGDKVLFNPEDRYEVEVRGEDYIILRERDIHAVAAERLEESPPPACTCSELRRAPAGSGGRRRPRSATPAQPDRLRAEALHDVADQAQAGPVAQRHDRLGVELHGGHRQRAGAPRP